MAPGSRRVKRESTLGLGLPTPESLYSAGTTPKREIDYSESVSDYHEDTTQGSSSHYDGLPRFEDSIIEDEGYGSRMDAQQGRRADSVSICGSRAPAQRQATSEQPDMEPMDQGLEFVGLKVKLLVDAINDLRQFGLGHVVQLPELVLVGDQSHGKSSLMSALTEVQLPKGSGICTRCPANIKTSPADTWSCKVSLEQYYRYENPRGRVIDEKSVTKNRPFPPWVEQPLQVKEFITIHDKSQLEDAIRWAQVALLNHDQDPTLFVPGRGSRAHNFEQERADTVAKFSPNLIAVEISGPDLPALSFYDLPGVFFKAEEKSDQYLAQVIRNLAKQYISRPNALIIWTLSMRSDPSNAQTGKLIQDCNALHRCVGVLTNPDHVAARHIEYERMLKGDAHVVRHGYFVTKQPGEDSPLQGDDLEYHSKARKEEIEYFDSEDHLWTGIWSAFRPRCGTRVIQEFLSQELARQIAVSLPQIREKINSHLQYVDQQLRDCPELPNSDIRNTVMKLLGQFSSDVRSAMAGHSLELPVQQALDIPDFNTSWTTLASQFRNLTLHIKPRIHLRHDSDIPRSSTAFVDLVSDDDESVVSTPSRKRPAQDPLSEQQPQRAKIIYTQQTGNGLKRENGLSSMRPPSSMQSPSERSLPATPRGARNNSNNPFAATPFRDLAHIGNGFMGLQAIRDAIVKHNSAGLPGLVDPKTYNEICLQAVNPWNHVLKILTDRTFEIVRNLLVKILYAHLGVYEQTALYDSSQRFLVELVDRLAAEEKASLTELYELENYKSFTVNDPYINEVSKKELVELRKARQSTRARALVEHQMRTDPKKKLAPDAPKEEKAKFMDFHMNKLIRDDALGPDAFDRELEVAAYVRAYYVTAAYRFVDIVCLSMQGKFFRQLREDLSLYLEDKLGIMGGDGEEKCRNLMEEDPGMFQKRRNLNEEKRKLELFSERLALLVEEMELPVTPPQNGRFADINGNGSSNGYQATVSAEDENQHMSGADDPINVDG